MDYHVLGAAETSPACIPLIACVNVCVYILLISVSGICILSGLVRWACFRALDLKGIFQLQCHAINNGFFLRADERWVGSVWRGRKGRLSQVSGHQGPLPAQPRVTGDLGQAAAFLGLCPHFCPIVPACLVDGLRVTGEGTCTVSGPCETLQSSVLQPSAVCSFCSRFSHAHLSLSSAQPWNLACL